MQYVYIVFATNLMVVFDTFEKAKIYRDQDARKAGIAKRAVNVSLSDIHHEGGD